MHITYYNVKSCDCKKQHLCAPRILPNSPLWKQTRMDLKFNKISSYWLFHARTTNIHFYRYKYAQWPFVCVAISCHMANIVWDQPINRHYYIAFSFLFASAELLNRNHFYCIVQVKAFRLHATIACGQKLNCSAFGCGETWNGVRVLRVKTVLQFIKWGRKNLIKCNNKIKINLLQWRIGWPNIILFHYGELSVRSLLLLLRYFNGIINKVRP